MYSATHSEEQREPNGNDKGFPSAIWSESWEHSNSAGLAEAAWVLSSRIGS